MDELERTVLATVTAISRGKAPGRGEVSGAERLREELGFDSLDMAQLVAELEIRLGFDPFARRPFSGIETVAHLVDAYRAAAGDG